MLMDHVSLELGLLAGWETTELGRGTPAKREEEKWQHLREEGVGMKDHPHPPVSLKNLVPTVQMNCNEKGAMGRLLKAENFSGFGVF